MKANFLYKLSCAVPSKKAFVGEGSGTSTSLLTFGIEAQNPWLSNHSFVASYRAELASTEFIPACGVRVFPSYTNPCLSFSDGGIDGVNIRGAESYKWVYGWQSIGRMGLGFTSLTGDSEAFEDYAARCARILRMTHTALSEYSALCPRLLQIPTLSTIKDSIILTERRANFDAELAELPSYEESDSERPLSPHFELDTCTELSMSGASSIIYWA